MGTVLNLRKKTAYVSKSHPINDSAFRNNLQTHPPLTSLEISKNISHKMGGWKISNMYNDKIKIDHYVNT